MQKFWPPIKISCLLLAINSFSLNAFADEAIDYQKQRINDQMNRSHRKASSFATDELRLPGPLALGIQYDTYTQYFLTASYAKQFSELFALAGLVEQGGRQSRFNATLGLRLSPSSGVFKISAEYLSQVLPFSFDSGEIHRRMGQGAFGVAYHYYFANAFYPAIQNINLKYYYAKANSANLDSITFISDGTNCPGVAGSVCFNERHLAGGTAQGVEAGTGVVITPHTQINAKINYDNVHYDTIFISSTTYNSKGVGAGLGVIHLFSDALKLSADANSQKIYNTYSANLSWLPPVAAQYRLELSLTEQYLSSRTSTATGDNMIGLKVGLDPMGGHKSSAQYSLASPGINSLEAYVRTPAVYMHRVLVIAEQRTSILFPALISLSPTSGPISGGTSVTLTGKNFTNANSVTFGGSTGSSLVVTSPTSITVTAPAHAPGIVDVVVTTPGGTSTSAGGYKYIPPYPWLYTVTRNGDNLIVSGSGLTTIWNGSTPLVGYTDPVSGNCPSGPGYFATPTPYDGGSSARRTDTTWSVVSFGSFFSGRCIDLCTDYSSTVCTNMIYVP